MVKENVCSIVNNLNWEKITGFCNYRKESGKNLALTTANSTPSTPAKLLPGDAKGGFFPIMQRIGFLGSSSFRGGLTRDVRLTGRNDWGCDNGQLKAA
ncbi:hypothetical protein ACOMHN_030289 [Nucella lapillus]